MHVIDRLDLRIALHGDGVETRHLAHLHERRLQRGERLHGGVGPHVLVLGKDREPVDILHRHDRFLEASFVPCLGGALLAFDGIGIDIVARKSVLRRDQVGRYALRQEVGLDGNRRVDRPGAAGRADANAAHRFGAAADRHFMLAGHDLRRGEVHRVET